MDSKIKSTQVQVPDEEIKINTGPSSLPFEYSSSIEMFHYSLKFFQNIPPRTLGYQIVKRKNDS